MSDCRVCGIELVAGDNCWQSYLEASNYICKDCWNKRNRVYAKNNYAKNPQKYKDAQNKYNKLHPEIQKAQNRKEYIQLVKIQQGLKSNGCVMCGYNKYTSCLSFHHTNPEDKNFPLTINNLYKSPEILAEEVNKCILLCVRCHAEIHAIDKGEKKNE